MVAKVQEIIRVPIICPECHRSTVIEMTLDEFSEWKMGGRHVQQIFPHKDCTQREVLITGLCPKCQDEIFKPPDEEEQP